MPSGVLALDDPMLVFHTSAQVDTRQLHVHIESYLT